MSSPVAVDTPGAAAAPAAVGVVIQPPAAAVGPSIVSAAAPAAITFVTQRLSVLVIAHVIVDCFSMTVIPLLSVLEGRITISQGQGALLLAVGSLCSGLIQPVVAAASDRYNTRIFGPLGLLGAALALSMLGFVTTYSQLLILQAVATAGIGAFHPVGASAMGQLSGRRRSMGVAVFFTGGMIGSTTGSLLVPWLNESFGLRSLMWFVVPGVVGAIALWLAVGAIPHRHTQAGDRAAALSPAEVRRRWSSVAILYAGNIARFTVNQALVTLVVRWAESITLSASGAAALDASLRESSSILNGRMQASMAIGMGIGGLLGAFVVRPGREKGILVGSAIIGVPAIICFPLASPWVAVALAICAGVGFASATPVSIAVAQRLLPHRTSFASSLMMGGAWVFAASGPLLAQGLIDGLGLLGAFVTIAILLGGAGALTVLLSSSLLLETAME
ncbi:MAG: MFS transporter [Phycisphaerales bacterium]|nr:MFS transporter [Phycisphaerales bacterium]